MRNITQENIRSIIVPIPSVRQRDEILGRVDQLLKLADLVIGNVSTAAAKIDKLPQAILAKALRGEVVGIEAELTELGRREYEPASATLERIRGETANQANSSPAQKRKLRRATAHLGA